MPWLLPFIYTIMIWGLWKIIKLLRNVQRVRRLGLSLTVHYYDPHPILLLIWVFYKRTSRAIGIASQAGVDNMMDKHGRDVYFKVYPSSVELVINDPECAANILSRRNDFIKLAEIAEKLNIFGPSVQTVEGNKWQRHRKITAPSFNECVSESVWIEALEQAEQMLESWKTDFESGSRNLAPGVNKLTIRVFSFAGIGIKHTDNLDGQCLPPGHSMAYADALTLILDNLIFLALFPLQFFTLPMLPVRLRKLGTATMEFRKYMQDILNDERGKSLQESDACPSKHAHNLAIALIQASETTGMSDDGGAASQGLSDEEIFGNLFIYNVAGYATTASAITYAVALLAAYPQWQDWVTEEIRQVDGEMSGAWKYKEAFPRLKRCLAVMLETLRLYPPAIATPKRVGPQPQAIHLHKKTYRVPPNTYVTITSEAIHRNPTYWGPDALTWRPSRWLHQTSSKLDGPLSPTKKPKGDCERKPDVEERLIEPQRGTYMPWSDGPRVCPGRKFSQVEFVAVMVGLFRRHHVRPKLLEGESVEGGQRRVLEMVGRRDELALTTQIEWPGEVALIWSER